MVEALGLEATAWAEVFPLRLVLPTVHRTSRGVVWIHLWQERKLGNRLSARGTGEVERRHVLHLTWGALVVGHWYSIWIDTMGRLRGPALQMNGDRPIGT